MLVDNCFNDYNGTSWECEKHENQTEEIRCSCYINDNDIAMNITTKLDDVFNLSSPKSCTSLLSSENSYELPNLKCFAESNSFDLKNASNPYYLSCTTDTNTTSITSCGIPDIREFNSTDGLFVLDTYTTWIFSDNSTEVNITDTTPVEQTYNSFETPYTPTQMKPTDSTVQTSTDQAIQDLSTAASELENATSTVYDLQINTTTDSSNHSSTLAHTSGIVTTETPETTSFSSSYTTFLYTTTKQQEFTTDSDKPDQSTYFDTTSMNTSTEIEKNFTLASTVLPDIQTTQSIISHNVTDSLSNSTKSLVSAGTYVINIALFTAIFIAVIAVILNYLDQKRKELQKRMRQSHLRELKEF